ncbi:hypothetical protein KIN20_006342 [Parelaphostrongylus tenuis]|uniref:Major facilitator superfamily associated domain-containing protein n=1 Tax=Parelaphostrongylus tenuis TaxID=148309 RepID=A0AAD5M1M6_PARTN|nr:hypothetical protein KIN20_006342 [Parelaphostrongylus tenuis]
MENSAGERTISLFGRVFPRDAFICRLFYLAYFASFGSLFPLLAVYFKQLGMTAAQETKAVAAVFAWFVDCLHFSSWVCTTHHSLLCGSCAGYVPPDRSSTIFENKFDRYRYTELENVILYIFTQESESK